MTHEPGVLFPLAFVSSALYSHGMPKKPKPTGRPPTQAPPGWVTVADAAEIRGVSHQVVRRFIFADEVHWQRLDNGVYFVLEEDLGYIVKREVAGDRSRIPVSLAPNRDRHKLWLREARRRKFATVNAFAAALLDEASGYMPPVESAE